MFFSKRTNRIRGLIIADPLSEQDQWCTSIYGNDPEHPWETHILWNDIFNNYIVVCPD